MESLLIVLLFSSVISASSVVDVVSTRQNDASSHLLEPSSPPPVLPSIPPVLPSIPPVLPSTPMNLPSSQHAGNSETPAIPTPTPVATSAVPATTHHAISPSASMHSTSMMSSSVPPTTAKPTTTTTPTTTPKPVPHFEVKGKNGTGCVFVEGNINIMTSMNNKSEDTTTPLVQDGAVATGNCYSNITNSSDITITWGKAVTFMLTFTSNSEMWFLSEVMVKLGNVSATGKYDAGSNDKLYQATFNQSYACARDQKLMLVSDSPTKENITVDFASIKMQPFSASKPFENTMMCPAKTDDSQTSSIVPIAVGCALAGLIVIVLIAYLIGRRKSSRGYQQV